MQVEELGGIKKGVTGEKRHKRSMFVPALCTCALFVAAAARIYERCELAQDLRKLGIPREHVATWVCIAFHESQLDTAALNQGSGDHGILQISELYWCGSGKVCGLSCSALRDDDITDDVACAMNIYEEHERLQGNGFMAWVVYPQYCNTNVKKYLINCDNATKMANTSEPRLITVYNETTYNYNAKIDDLQPPYISVNDINEEVVQRKKQENKNGRSFWYTHKIDNIDELKVPKFNEINLTTKKPVATSAIIDLDEIKVDKNKIKEKNIAKKVSYKDINKQMPLHRSQLNNNIISTEKFHVIENRSKISTDSHKHVTTAKPITDESKSTTEDVFELYLNTHRPVLSTYSFAPFIGKRFKINIFSDGSTTPRYNMKSERAKISNDSTTKNHLKRQTL